MAQNPAIHNLQGCFSLEIAVIDEFYEFYCIFRQTMLIGSQAGQRQPARSAAPMGIQRRASATSGKGWYSL